MLNMIFISFCFAFFLSLLPQTLECRDSRHPGLWDLQVLKLSMKPQYVLKPLHCVCTALYACQSTVLSFLLFHSKSWMSHCSFQGFLWQGLPNFWKRLDVKYFKCIQLPDFFSLADVNFSRCKNWIPHFENECPKDPHNHWVFERPTARFMKRKSGLQHQQHLHWFKEREETGGLMSTRARGLTI